MEKNGKDFLYNVISTIDGNSTSTAFNCFVQPLKIEIDFLDEDDINENATFLRDEVVGFSFKIEKVEKL
jgi:hypothetical protein